MAVYNGQEFIRKSLESVLKQTYGDFQFLIINDASTDETVSLIRAYDDPRIRLENNEKNLGLAATLNRGLEMIDTEFAARMDCDDICHPRRFEWQVSFMEEHPTCGISGTWARSFGLPGQRATLRYPELPDEARVCQFFRSPVAHPTIILRKALLDRHQLRYDPLYSRTEDFDLCVRASDFFEIRNIPRIAFYYRRHLQSVTIRNEAEMIGQVRKIVKRQLGQIGLTPSETELDLHCRPCLGWGAQTPDELVAAEEWFHKLHRRLQESGKFASSALDKELGRQWFLFCRNSACLGTSAWHAFLRSKSKHRAAATLKERGLFQAAVFYHTVRSASRPVITSKSDSSSGQPFVSVVMPMRNAEAFLHDSVGSVINQTYQNFEFIILDDDSSDGSRNFVQSLKDHRIRLIINEKQMGVAETLNRGLSEARGKYIARMDADDISLPERLARQVAYLENHPEIAAVGTRVDYFGGPWGMLDLRPCASAVCGAFLIFATPIVHPTAMIRRELLNGNGLMYRSVFSRSEDYDLWVRLVEFGGLANLPEVLLRYRLHPQSVTSQHQETMAIQHRQIVLRALKNRNISLPEEDIELLCRIIRGERSEALSALADSAALLKRIVREEPATPVAMRQATAVAWLRYCANNGHFGLKAWRVYREAELDSDVPAATLYRNRFMASCIWHEVRGPNKAV